MKAFLLAAGAGTRLRPLTETVPKCLLAFGGRTLLDRWLDMLACAGAGEVLVNVHHLAGAVEDHLASRSGPPAVRASFEPELLGSAGTLAAHRTWVEDEEVFLVANADNLTDFDLGDLLAFHRRGGHEASLAVFHAPDPSACGIVEVDVAGTVVGYEEKPARPATDLANAGIYAFSPSVIGEITGPPPRDIGSHLLPKLVGRAGALEVAGAYLRDIGTPASYRRAQLEWAARSAQGHEAAHAGGAR